MRLECIETPALVLDLDVFEMNMAMMKRFTEEGGWALRPHYKSHKSTAIAHLQIKAGAKGITCAKLAEAEDLVRAGIEDVLIANQIVEPVKVARAAYLAGCCKLTVCVDKADNIDALQRAAAEQNTTIYCLVEYEIGMNRCGVDTEEDFCALAHQINRCSNLVFEGIQAYAGHLSHEADYEKRKIESEKVELRLGSLIKAAKLDGLEIREVSGASTGTVEFRGKDTVYTEIQAGSYIFMDAAYNTLHLKFENALFVLASIISTNNRMIVSDAGLKCIAVDQKPPVFQDYPHLSLKVSEEHSSIPAPGITAAVGDRVLIIPGHCCTTVNLHDFYYLVRSNTVVDRIPVTSRGKSL